VSNPNPNPSPNPYLTYNVQIPVVCTIPALKQLLIEHVNEKQQVKVRAS
jgi:hypothetical protein